MFFPQNKGNFLYYYPSIYVQEGETLYFMT